MRETVADGALSLTDVEALLRRANMLATQDAIHFRNSDARVEVPLAFRAVLES